MTTLELKIDDTIVDKLKDMLKNFGDKVIELKELEKEKTIEKELDWENFAGGLDKNFKIDDIRYREIIK